MNRVIKFRAWCSGKHGSLTFSENSMDYNVVISKNGNWCDVESGWDIHGEYETVPVMQYTGMKDYNGKEIYEGDILRIVTESGYYEIGQVIYKEITARYGFLSPDGSVYGLHTHDPRNEIIGNIYENPELLNS